MPVLSRETALKFQLFWPDVFPLSPIRYAEDKYKWQCWFSVLYNFSLLLFPRIMWILVCGFHDEIKRALPCPHKSLMALFHLWLVCMWCVCSCDPVTGLSAVDKTKQEQTKLCIVNLCLFRKGWLNMFIFHCSFLKWPLVAIVWWGVISVGTTRFIPLKYPHKTAIRISGCLL